MSDKNITLSTKVSPHFNIGEFIQTNTNPEVYKPLNFKYAVEKINVLEELATKILEPIRKHMIENYGFKCLVINSGVRCPELNKAIGGSMTSQHSHCEAVDINCSKDKTKSSKADKLAFAKRLYLDIIEKRVAGLVIDDIGQCILEMTTAGGVWIHISLRTERYIESRKRSGRSTDPEFLLTPTGKAGSFIPYTPAALSSLR